MKGLSLTLTIVIVAIVLLVTALVIITIFSSEITRIMVALGIVSNDAFTVNICQQKCAQWCSANRLPDIGWDTFKIQIDPNTEPAPCGPIMTSIVAQCECRTIGG